ncbi:O-antigen ligase family protein, partial [Saprospiraceae bacterium]|nr:O-antigen ligase family protein [Saprospiraceae bacterium]
IFLASLFLLMYLIKIPSMLDEYMMGRFDFWSVLCFLGLWLILPQVSKSKGIFHWMDGIVFSFYFLNLISVSWATNFGEAIFTTQKYLLFFITYYTLRHLLHKGKDYSSFLEKVILVLTIFVCALTSYQILQTFLADGLGGKAIYKVASFSGHKNLTASYIYLLFCFNLYFSFSKKQPTWHYGLLGVQLILIILLRSRAVYLALFVSSLILLTNYVFLNKNLRQLVFRKILPFTLLVAVFGTLIIGNTSAGKDYLKSLNPSTYYKSASGIERIFIWYKTVELVQERPILGYGSGNWKLEIPSKSITGGYRLKEKDVVFTRVHNDFLEILAEVGTVGLLLYLSMFLFAIIGVISRIREVGVEKEKENMVLIASLIGYMVIAFFDFPKERLEHQILLALLISLCTLKGTLFFKNRKWYLPLSPSSQKVLIAGLTIFLSINIPVGYYRTMADKSSEQILVGMGLKNSKLMRDQARRANSEWCNLNVMVIPFKWYEGLSYYFENNFEAAEAPFAEAYRLNPYNFNVLNNYASTLVQLEKFEEAIPYYLRALEINSKFEEGMFNLSFAYFQLKRYEDALEWVNKVEKNLEKKKVFLERIQTPKVKGK